MSDEELECALYVASGGSTPFLKLSPEMRVKARCVAKRARELLSRDQDAALLAERNALAQENAGLRDSMQRMVELRDGYLRDLQAVEASRDELARERDWYESARKSVAQGLHEKRAECEKLHEEQEVLRSCIGRANLILAAALDLDDDTRIADLARGDGRGT